jgi:SpoVK/Ycf46/Vps4 family AAA+-type ATPase
MDIKDIIKLQMMGQITQMNHGQAHGNAQSHSANTSMLIYQVLLMGVMSVTEDIMKAIPRVFEALKRVCVTFFASQVKQSIERPRLLHDLSVPLNTRHFQTVFAMSRNYESQGQSSNNASACEEANSRVDAVLAHVSRLANVPSFQLTSRGKVIVSYKDKPIQMTKDIYFKVEQVNFNDVSEVSSVKVHLLSNTVTAADLAAYVTDIHDNYVQDIKNSLGNRIYYFDQKARDNFAAQPPPTTGPDASLQHRRMLISSAPKQLSYTMSPFYSNKRLSNIFGDEARRIEQRIRFFVENRDWYDEKGIPYQIGILLSGVPGAGKTSIIKAIANFTKRHVINVNFANIATASQLKSMFYSDRIQVYTDSSMSSTQSYFIPVDQRIYVLEEVDAIGNVVRSRQHNQTKQHQTDNLSQTIPDELTLADILTVMDGTMETPGRIVIMTTNHPEVLDTALIRPGRIDVHVNFGNATRETIVDMFAAYFDRLFPADLVHKIPDSMLTPAEVGQVMFQHLHTKFDASALVQDMLSAAGKRASASASASEPGTPEVTQTDSPSGSVETEHGLRPATLTCLDTDVSEGDGAGIASSSVIRGTPDNKAESCVLREIVPANVVDAVVDQADLDSERNSERPRTQLITPQNATVFINGVHKDVSTSPMFCELASVGYNADIAYAGIDSLSPECDVTSWATYTAGHF